MKSPVFNGLLMLAAVAASYLPIRAMPDRRPLPEAQLPLTVRPVTLPPAAGPLKLAGAWQLEASDRRFGGLSALAIDDGKLLAVTDRGAVIRFDFPASHEPYARLADLRDGPGRFGKKMTRDAESMTRDLDGRGWWVGFEQHHSLWLYDAHFRRALAQVELAQPWRDNRGAEGLLADQGALLVTAENGRDAIEVASFFSSRVELDAGADVADAARAPDGSAWLLLRSKGLRGIRQSIAPLMKDGIGYRAGPGWPVPKGSFDNFEGMAIEPKPDGGWRFWLVTDDGHRIMARTLLVALDFDPQAARYHKGPAPGARPSQMQPAKRP